jgi:hypothetical protein
MSSASIENGVSRLVREAHDVLAPRGLSPRTLRLTLPASGPEEEAEGALLSRLRWVNALARTVGARWFCVPLDLVVAGPRHGRLAAVLDAVVRFDKMFLNLIIAADEKIAVNAVDDVARLVLDVSRKSNNGFDNFRVGASCNCPPNAPFFPFSRHEGCDIAFSFALETTPLAMQALATIDAPHDPALVRDRLVTVLTPHLASIDELGRSLAERSEARYCGMDASFAPMPLDAVSVAALVEHITGAPIGSHGSVLATSFLTDAVRTAIRRSGARGVGFNGVMYSILEDPALAAANNKRRISLDALMVLCAVCACGLDMVPVPGLSFPEEIGALVLDVAALSCAFHKPLGVRVLPIPDGHVNDFTRLNLDFLCDSRVVALSSNDRRMQTTEHAVGLRSPRVDVRMSEPKP